MEILMHTKKNDVALTHHSYRKLQGNSYARPSGCSAKKYKLNSKNIQEKTPKL